MTGTGEERVDGAHVPRPSDARGGGIEGTDVGGGAGGASDAGIAADVLAGGGEMGARMRAFDWARTAVGPVATWPASLRTLVRLLLDTRQPMFLWWGPELTQFYNDGYRQSLGEDRHPAALGARGRDFWADAWPIVGPEIESMLAGGAATWHEDRLVPIRRNGRLEDVYWTYGYTPVRDDGGAVAGVLATVVESTPEVRERLARLREIEARTAAGARAETALRESEARYRSLFESIDEGFCVVEVLVDGSGRPVDYRWVETNPAFEQQTGLTDAVGRTARELVPGLEEQWVATYGRVALTGEPTRFQSGSAAMGRWFDVYAFRIGRPEERRVALLFKDISAARAAEQERQRLTGALEVERARLRQVFEQAPVAVAVLRGRVVADLLFELVNPRYLEMIPGDRAPLGRRLGDALPEVATTMGAVLQDVLDRGVPFQARDYCVPLDRDGDGTPEDYYFNFVYHPLVESTGTVTGIVGVGTEVTESVRARRNAERERERADRLQALTAALAGARTLDDVATVVVADMVVALGARTGALAGRAPEGDALVLLRTVGFPEPVAAGVRRQALDLRSPLVECFRTQSPLWIESRDGPAGLDVRYPIIAPVWDALGVAAAAFLPLVAAGETVGVISFAFDAPRSFADEERAFLLALGQQAALAVERARLFDAERAARTEAERANRAKSEFLAVMSHELRTPLNAIGGYAELMELGIRGPVTEQQREDLRRIQASQRHLLGLINEVLNYARLETGTVRYDLVDVRLADALSEAEGLVAPQARAKGITLQDRDGGSDVAIRADAEKLRQILVNLLSNAVKFTDRGGSIHVECDTAGDLARIRVRDTGIGIAADKLESIFEPFVQVRADLTRTAEGTGLGLAISRDLARGMGGELTAESAPGVGSTFTLVLPRA